MGGCACKKAATKHDDPESVDDEAAPRASASSKRKPESLQETAPRSSAGDKRKPESRYAVEDGQREADGRSGGRSRPQGGATGAPRQAAEPRPGAERRPRVEPDDDGVEPPAVLEPAPGLPRAPPQTRNIESTGEQVPTLFPELWVLDPVEESRPRAESGAGQGSSSVTTSITRAPRAKSPARPKMKASEARAALGQQEGSSRYPVRQVVISPDERPMHADERDLLTNVEDSRIALSDLDGDLDFHTTGRTLRLR